MQTVAATDILDDPRDGRPRLARDAQAGSIVADGGMDLMRLERILSDIQNEPNWRYEADKCSDYYDGNQLDAETISKLDDKGLGPLITNLVKPTVDAVLGLEAKTRTDWNVVADDEQVVEVAEAINAKLHEAERETRADRARSDAYAGQVKAGFSAVEVSRSTNPFDYTYRVQMVHRRELYWDWRSTRYDWKDARYVVRKRWNDADVVAAFFPQHRELILAAAASWSGNWQSTLFLPNASVAEMLNNGINVERRTNLEDQEWRDTERGRVCVFEVWYRTWHRGAVLALPNGRKVEYDEHKPEHVAAVATGRVKVRVGVFDKLRCAYFIGPHRVADFATTRRNFPYLPFFGYREDTTGIPYGLIRAMISPQDEINARRAKMMWLLSQKRVQIDSDALDQKYNTLSDGSRELARSDGFIVMNPNRVNRQAALKVDENLELGQFQFRLLEESKNALQQAGGIYSSMLGAPSNVTANSAMQTLIEQGTITLAEINDNYVFASRLVGEALVDLIREDLDGQSMTVPVDTGTVRKSVYINRPAVDQKTGQRYLENNTSTAAVRVGLTDVPSTPSYRAHQLVQLTEIAKSLPPTMQGFFTPFILELTDLPTRRQLADLMRRQLGMPPDPNSQEGKQQIAAQEKQVAEAAAMQTRKIAADIAEQEAKTRKLLAEAEAARRGQEDHGGAEQIDALTRSHREQIDALKAQIVELRAQAAGSTAQANIKADAELAKAAEETERERIRADAAIAAAQIAADADKRVEEVTRQMDKLRADLEKQIGDLKSRFAVITEEGAEDGNAIE